MTKGRIGHAEFYIGYNKPIVTPMMLVVWEIRLIITDMATFNYVSCFMLFSPLKLVNNQKLCPMKRMIFVKYYSDPFADLYILLLYLIL